VGDSGYERLAAQDSSFVKFEGAGTPAHVSAIAYFDPLSQRRSSPESDAFNLAHARKHVLSRLHAIPHARQRLAFTPIQGHPIWVDDPYFDVDYHVRHVALPRPGTPAQLRELASHLVSQPLDLRRPLWELTFVEGNEDGGLAVIAKIHHCMIDGVSGVGVLMALLDPTPEVDLVRPQPWTPRPHPGALQFLGDGLGEGARLGWSTLQTLGDSLLSPRATADAVLETASAGFEAILTGLVPPADTPLNGPIGTQRRLDWRSLDLAEVRDVRKRLDGSINDVLLTVVSGAIRRYLQSRRVRLAGLDFRVIVPVDVRTGDERDGVGNRVSAWFVSLPVASRKPRVRFEKVREQTRRMKSSHTERSVDRFLRFADWAGSTRLTFWGVNFVNWVSPYNLVVTNVHGPQFPLYLLGARLRSFTPVLPLFQNQGLAIAALSYHGRLDVGLSADRDLLPDLGRVGDFIEESFAELKTAAEQT
jgi:WS/DGAT/MGAT family acyltransferase